MLHSLEMPSFLAEDAVPPTSANGSHAVAASSYAQRKSVERTHSGTGSYKDSDRRVNGELINGVNGNGSATHLPNGHRSPSEKRSLENGGPVEPVVRRSRMSNEKSRPGDLERLATRDDGYFASGVTAKVQEGWFSNKVSLDMNGDGQWSSKRDSSVSRDDTPRERKSTVEASERTSADRTSESLRPSRDQPFRTSAPPSSTNHSAQNLLPPNKLQQRHTLEVPRASTSRLSRDTYATDEATATGRFSPSTPTRRRNSVSLVRRVTRSINSDLHLDDAAQDPDTAAYTEMVKQKRQSRRDRKKEEEEDRVLVGTKVDQNHVNYVMAYNMLTGIRFTVSRTNAKMDRDLTEADFEAKHKFSFDV
jgi:1-phosphatidylinositol-4-phosphate 5-kinase